MKGNPKNIRKKIIRCSKKDFKKMFETINILPSFFTKPLLGPGMFGSDSDPDLGLFNPYSKVTCMVLYLYSMELGTPPLYAEANRVSRDMDLGYVKELGPYLKCLYQITLNSEKYKRREDKITTG